MTKDAERRQQPRLDERQSLFVRVTSAGGEIIDEGQSVRCSTENVSTDGFRLWLPEPVSEGTILELWVRIEGDPETFRLKGVTKWAKNHKGGRALVGVQLIDDAAHDMGAWRATVIRKLRDTP